MSVSHCGNRIVAIDFARFIAFSIMIFVNFKLVIGMEPTMGVFHAAVGLVEGKAAATFITIAGFGIGLLIHHYGVVQARVMLIKKSLFLFIIGGINLVIFDADILHYYGIYFLIAAFLVTASIRHLFILIIIVNMLHILAMSVLNYDTGWNWQTLTYLDLFTIKGFTRHLLFNGWHPIFPWISFLLLGLVIQKIQLQQKYHRLMLTMVGLIIFILTELVSQLLIFKFSGTDLAYLVTTQPLPPFLLFVLSGCGAALFIIGFSLLIVDFCQQSRFIRWCSQAGKLSLTLYLAHILIGMSILEKFNLLKGQSLASVVMATVIFCLWSVLFSNLWLKHFRQGPVELVMKKLTS